MPTYKSIECGAATKIKGRQCRRRTIATSPYCYQHARIIQGLQVKKSKIKAAGKGLYAARDFKKNERIEEYTGVRTNTAPANIATNDYIAEVKSKDEGSAWINAENPTKSSIMRYANDCSRKDKECTSNNATFYYYRKPGPKPKNRRDKVVNPNKTRMYVKAKRPIKKGAEIYLGYGTDYWRWKRKSAKLKAKKANR